MTKNLKLSLVLLIALVVLNFGGCSSSSSGVAPVPPSDIPTTIEYAGGEVVIVGSLGGVSGNIAAMKSGSSVSIDASYAVSSASSTAGTIDDNNCVYYTPPANAVYKIIFLSQDNVYYYQNTGSHTVSTLFLSGASAGGTVEMSSDCTLASSFSEDAIHLGTITFTPASELRDILPADGDSEGATFMEEQGFTDDQQVEDYIRFDPGAIRMPDREFIREHDYFGSFSTQHVNLYANSVFTPTQTLDQLYDTSASGEYPDPDTLDYTGYSLTLELYSNPSAGSATLAIQPFDETVLGITDANGTFYANGDSIPSCAGSGSRVYNFFYTGIPCYVAVSPSSPPAGSYTITDSSNTYPMILALEPDLTNISNTVGIPIALPKLTISGSNITGVEWKWVMKDDTGTWTQLTRGRLASMIGKTIAGYGYFYFVIGNDSGTLSTSVLDTGWETTDSDAMRSNATGQATFETSFSPGDVTTISISYIDISGFGYIYSWEGIIQ